MHLSFLFGKFIHFENLQIFINCLLFARYLNQCYFHLILRNVKVWYFLYWLSVGVCWTILVTWVELAWGLLGRTCFFVLSLTTNHLIKNSFSVVPLQVAVVYSVDKYLTFVVCFKCIFAQIIHIDYRKL